MPVSASTEARLPLASEADAGFATVVADGMAVDSRVALTDILLTSRIGRVVEKAAVDQYRAPSGFAATA